MSYNGSHTCIVRLAYRASGFSKVQTRNYIRTLVFPIKSVCQNEAPSSFYQFRRCFQSGNQADDESDFNRDHDYTSSRFHQQHHRRSFERKRSSYDKENINRDQFRSNGYSQVRHEPNINHYQRLNIESKADISAIKSAYYSLSKLYHPDVVGSDNREASENFRLITESYETLSDQEKRQEYDRQLDLVRDDRSNISDAAWRPRNSGNNPTFQRRNSDLIFRMKMDQAFELEKLKNPKKFQAGSFKDQHEDSTPEERLLRMERQLRTLESVDSRGQGHHDGSDFYRMHMRDTIRRRQIGLRSSDMYAGSSGSSTDLPPLIALVSAGIFILYTIVNIFFDIDIAADLDSKLKIKRDNDD